MDLVKKCKMIRFCFLISKNKNKIGTINPTLLKYEDMLSTALDMYFFTINTPPRNHSIFKMNLVL